MGLGVAEKVIKPVHFTKQDGSDLWVRPEDVRRVEDVNALFDEYSHTTILCVDGYKIIMHKRTAAAISAKLWPEEDQKHETGS